MPFVGRGDLRTIYGRGLKGDTGAQGPTGPAGAAGAPGGSDPAFASWIRTPASETAEALADGYAADPNPSLIGGTARWYGDSWSAGFGLAAGQSYIQRAAAEHGITSFENVAVSGSAAQSIGTLMIAAAGAFHWDEGDADLVVFNGGLNDARYSDLSLAANHKWLKSMKHSIRIAVALALGKQRIGWDNYTRWAYAGAGWFSGPYLYSTNGATVGVTQSTGNGATFSFAGDEVTIVCGGFHTETTCVADFAIDGEHVRTVRFVDDGVLYPSSGSTIGYRAERFTGLGPGPHTITITKADTTNAALYLDCGIERSDAPPLVLVNKEPTLPADVYAMYDPYDNGNDNSIRAMQKVMDDVAAEFPGVRLCDLPTLAPVTDFQADLIHPNTAGRDKLQAAVSAALGPAGLGNRVEDLAPGNRIRRALDAPRKTVVTRLRAGAALQPYNIPEGATALRIRVGGGAGGAGSGRRGAAGTVRCGGGAGAGAGYDEITLATFGLPRTIYAWAGAGGPGGAAVTTDDTNGNNGTNGVASYVVTDPALPADESIYLAYAAGGARGLGGTNAAGTGGASTVSRMGQSGSGGAASATGGAGGTTAVNGFGGTGQGGGAGGGISAANAAAAGGAGWWSGLFLLGTIAAPAAGTNTGGAGGAGTATTMQGRFAAGPSGGGGGANLAGAGGAGGAGGLMSGGGGGGASVNGNASGAGGKGGDGFVEITAFF